MISLPGRLTENGLLALVYKTSVGDFRGRKYMYISTENLFKIPQKSGVAKIPLAELLQTHLGVKIDPQDTKSLRVCAKCALKILIASTLCEFIRTALGSGDINPSEESDDPSVSSVLMSCPLKEILYKKNRPYSSPSTKQREEETVRVSSGQKRSAKRNRLHSFRNRSS